MSFSSLIFASDIYSFQYVADVSPCLEACLGAVYYSASEREISFWPVTTYDCGGDSFHQLCLETKNSNFGAVASMVSNLELGNTEHEAGIGVKQRYDTDLPEALVPLCREISALCGRLLRKQRDHLTRRIDICYCTAW